MGRSGLLLAAVLFILAVPALSAAEDLALPEAQGEALQKAEAVTREERWVEAAALWEAVTRANPHDGAHWSRLARARYRTGEFRQAIPAFRKAIELRAGFPWSSAYEIARCHARLGEKEQAFAALERALAMGYRYLRAAQRDEDFASLRDDPRFRKLVGLVDTSRMSRVEGWRTDLDLWVREIKRVHYRPFRHVSETEFDARVRALRAAIPKLSDTQIAVGMMKLARLIGDGHTLLRPAYLQEETRRALPVRFYLFEEGLFITDAAPEQADLLGARVLRFGDHAVERVMESLDTIVSQDNPIWVKHVGPNLLRNPQLLNGLGLIPEPERVSLTLRDAEGKTRTVTLTASAGEPGATWKRVTDALPAPPPLALRKPGSPYWCEHLSERKAVYFQYNAVLDDPKESIARFCERLFRFIEEQMVERLIIDMRFNDGGNNFLNQPLVHGLIRCDRINRKGRLFLLVGRNTFSAAMNGATDIERHTEAIFIGEPTGSSPNFVGESVIVILPYSKIWSSISDLYWQRSVAMDYRPWIAPRLHLPLTFADYRAGRDPALDAALAYR